MKTRDGVTTFMRLFASWLKPLTATILKDITEMTATRAGQAKADNYFMMGLILQFTDDANYTILEYCSKTKGQTPFN